MDHKLEQWRKDGKYLPEFLKDFHDQKDFFKFLHEFTKVHENELLKDISWVDGQIYTIDIVLRVLARFGWTLQRNRSQQNFDNLDEIMGIYTKQREEIFTNLLLQQMNKSKEDKINQDQEKDNKNEK